MENEKELLKEKIRERYKGINPEDCEIIPAFEQPKLYDENSQKRVAAYARVSTIDINQTTSYELQKNHYTDLINKHEGWNLVKIYADTDIFYVIYKTFFNNNIINCFNAILSYYILFNFSILI